MSHSTPNPRKTSKSVPTPQMASFAEWFGWDKQETDGAFRDTLAVIWTAETESLSDQKTVDFLQAMHGVHFANDRDNHMQESGLKGNHSRVSQWVNWCRKQAQGNECLIRVRDLVIDEHISERRARSSSDVEASHATKRQKVHHPKLSQDIYCTIAVQIVMPANHGEVVIKQARIAVGDCLNPRTGDDADADTIDMHLLRKRIAEAVQIADVARNDVYRLWAADVSGRRMMPCRTGSEIYAALNHWWLHDQGLPDIALLLVAATSEGDIDRLSASQLLALVREMAGAELSVRIPDEAVLSGDESDISHAGRASDDNGCSSSKGLPSTASTTGRPEEPHDVSPESTGRPHRTPGEHHKRPEQRTLLMVDVAPSIHFGSMPGFIKQMQQEWLSDPVPPNAPSDDAHNDDDDDDSEDGGGEDDVDEVPSEVEEILGDELATHHLDRELFKRIGRFLNADPKIWESTSTLWFPGWNADNPAMLSQLYATLVGIIQQASGRDVFWQALDVGLGKTIVGWAGIRLYAHFKRVYDETTRTDPGEGRVLVKDDPSWKDPHPDAFMNLTDLMESQKPRIRQGISMLIVPRTMKSNWMEEFKKFVDPEGSSETEPLYICDMDTTVTKIIREAWPCHWYHINDSVSLHKAFPGVAVTLEWLSRYFTPELAAEWVDKGEIPVADLLTKRQRRKGVQAEWWQRMWCVIVTPKLTDKIATYDPSTGKAMDGYEFCIGQLWIDEAHDTSGLDTSPYKTVGVIPGGAVATALTATPFHKPKNLSGIIWTFMRRYMVCEKDDWIWPMTALKREDFSGRQIVKINDELGLSQAERDYIEAGSWTKIAKDAALIDNYVSSHSLGKAQVARRHEKDVELKEAMARLREWLEPQMLRWPSFAPIWNMSKNHAPMPVVEIPPHQHYDVYLHTSPGAAEALSAFYAANRSSASKNGGQGFTSFLHKMSVYSAVPELLVWQAESPELDEEIKGNGLRREGAELIGQGAKISRIDEYFRKMWNTSIMKAIVHALADGLLREDAVKFTIPIFKPWLAAFVCETLQWGARQAQMNPAFCPALSGGPDVIGSMHAFDSGQSYSKQKKELLDDFHDLDKDPYVLVYVARAAPYGQNLVPASIVLLIDHVWEGHKIYQVIARVRRSARVQKAPRTESARLIIDVGPGCPFSGFIADRHTTTGTIMRQIAG